MTTGPEWVKWANTERWFPIQTDYEVIRQRRCGRQIIGGPVHVRWSDAEVAYESYHAIWGNQTMQRLADRGGFGWMEYLALCAVTRWLRSQAQHGERTSRKAHRVFYDWLAANATADDR